MYCLTSSGIAHAQKYESDILAGIVEIWRILDTNIRDDDAPGFIACRPNEVLQHRENNRFTRIGSGCHYLPSMFVHMALIHSDDYSSA